MPREDYWWLRVDQCMALRKDGKRCQRTARSPYEIGPGNLYIPITCCLHVSQEDAIRAELAKQPRGLARVVKPLPKRG